MTIADNKKTVLSFIHSMAAATPDETLLTEDASWWVPGMGNIDREGFFKLVKAFSSLAAGPATMTIVAVTAEDDRVAVEADGKATLKDGRVYANTYHFLFYLRDGKIRHAREHNDTAVARNLFGDSMRKAIA
jgi:ketosteroid isomerase-like protein